MLEVVRAREASVDPDLSASPTNLLSHSAWTIALNASTLGVNLIAGILIARAVGAQGRGVLSAVTLPPQLIGWAFALGCGQAASYYQAKYPREGARLIGTWLALLVPLSAIALISGEALLPVLLRAQSSRTVVLASIYMFTIVMILLGDLIYGLLLGDQDFLFFNIMRFAQPAVIALAYLCLSFLGKLSVESALVAATVPTLIGMAIATARAVMRHGIGRPSMNLARATLWYGLKAHGANVSGILSSRLDLLIIPAFLSASSVGLYSVATAVSGMVMTLSGALSVLALPIAARNGTESAKIISQLMRATVVLGSLLGLLVGVLGGFGIRLLYGNGFAASVPILWVLLPGTLAWAMAAVVQSALYAANRPLSASLTYSVGVLITVPGLLIFLQSGGLLAAAVVSTVSYVCVCAVALRLYSGITGVRLRAFLPGRGDAIWVAREIAIRFNNSKFGAKP